MPKEDDGAEQAKPEQANSDKKAEDVAMSPRGPPKGGSKWHSGLLGGAGNVLEWYDFAIFGFFADEIGSALLPGGDDDSKLLETYIIFGVAFLVRPIGGLLFGWIGDTWGRKTALIMSVALMGIPTTAIGLLPKYDDMDDFGWVTVLLLVLLRLVQGISVGGQLIGSYVFTSESAPADKRGLYTATCRMMGDLGVLLAAGVAAIIKACLTDSEVRDWGWRLPFLAGIVISGIAYALQRLMQDPRVWERTQKYAKKREHPFKEVWKKHTKTILLVACVISLWPTAFYTYFVWLPSYLEEKARHKISHASNYLVIALAGLCVVLPFTGWLVDQGDNRPHSGQSGWFTVMAIGAFLMVFITPMSFWALDQAGDDERTNHLFFAIAMIPTVIGLCMYGAPLPLVVCGAFPVETRFTAVAIAYNISQMIFGGFSPLIATAITDSSNQGVWVGIYVSCVALIACGGIIGLRIKHGTHDHIRDGSAEDSTIESNPVSAVQMKEGANQVRA